MPQVLVSTAVKFPESPSKAEAMVKEKSVAPGMAIPSLNHWTVAGGSCAAETVSVTDSPSQSSAPSG